MATRPLRRGPATDDRRRLLVTPEGITLALTLATRGSRAGALLLDLVIIVASMIATTLALLWIAGGVGVSLDKAAANSATGHALQFLAICWIIALFLYRNAYFLFFELGPRGATPGKRAAGIRVAARDGGRLTTEAVIARNIIRDIELFMPVLFLSSASQGGDMALAGWAGLAWVAVFVLFPCFNRDRLRCGDIIAGTWVVEAPRRKLEQAMSVAPASAGASVQTGTTYRFGEPELAAYGEYELQVLEQVLRENRPEAMREVAATICRKIGWDVGQGDERAFLDAYYTQLRARLERGMRFGQRKADKYAGSGKHTGSGKNAGEG
ncbi:RDD family protein [Novosphingobium lentum]|uniref:RDD family protein n=1 Tax=Novosphingobium lentum TaxID=145287 RepID=UPI0008361705|nr:RDD family protein [Novosphingobium lentum]